MTNIFDDLVKLYDEGFAAGDTEGYNAGVADGYDEGYEAGHADADACEGEAYNEGYSDGYEAGRADAAAEAADVAFNASLHWAR